MSPLDQRRGRVVASTKPVDGTNPMIVKLTEAQRKLLEDGNLAYVASLTESGRIQVTPMWVEYDGTHVLLNCVDSRARTQHVQRDPHVTICVGDKTDPYRYAEVRGKVVHITTEGAHEMMERLAKRYENGEKNPFYNPDQVRVIFKIVPEKVFSP
jgi:PPOX class probable F420-dependent enzyme